MYQTCFNDTDVARRSICDNHTNNEQDLLDEDLVQIVSFSVFILFGIIGIIGFIGNALVVIGEWENILYILILFVWLLLI